jgi:hypothetical protein
MLLNETEQREAQESLTEAKKTEQTNDRVSEGFFIGVDIGQQHDYTAIVGVERVRITTFDKWVRAHPEVISLNDPMSEYEPVYKSDIEYHVRLIERLQLGTKYTDVVRYLINLVNAPKIKELKPTVIIDYIGVGRGIYDMAVEQPELRTMKAVTATGGEAIKDDDPFFHVPKVELATTAQGLFSRQLLQIAKDLANAEELTREIKSYIIKRTPAGNLQFEAQQGSHDDLTSALEMACWIATQHEVIPLVAPITHKRPFDDQSMRRTGKVSRGSYAMENKGYGGYW